MGSAAPAFTATAPAVRYAVPVERLRHALLWLTGLSSAFVFIEPSPYEVVALLTMVVFLVTGMRLSAPVMPLAVLLVILNLGFSFALVPVMGQSRTLQWVLVSWYLAATAIFFAIVLGENTEKRLDWLVRGWMLAALVASLAGIAGYFGLVPGFSDMLTRYGRAQGTFNDPNVLGAFLIPPALFALQRLLRGSAASFIGGSMLLGIYLVAILLSFSRAAWGQFAFCAALLMLLTFLAGPSPRARLRVALLALAAIAALAVTVAAMLSIDAVEELFRERASLQQSYDAGPTGRFGRYVSGLLMALESPGGIGPLQFMRHFPEDPHNSYLNTLVTGGWMSGLAYSALVLLTLVMAARYLFVPTPWQGAYLVIFTGYAGVAAESFLIDTDHWRHYFLLLGVMWALMIATARYRAEPGPVAPRPVAPRPVAPRPVAARGPATATARQRRLASEGPPA